MPDATYAITGRKPSPDTGFAGDAALITWTLTQGQSGESVQLAAYTDRTVQFAGTWGGTSISLEGSMDGTTYTVLTDPQGNAITKTANAIEAVTEGTVYVRPKATGGDGTTSVKVMLLAKGDA